MRRQTPISIFLLSLMPMIVSASADAQVPLKPKLNNEHVYTKDFGKGEETKNTVCPTCLQDPKKKQEACQKSYDNCMSICGDSPKTVTDLKTGKMQTITPQMIKNCKTGCKVQRDKCG